MGRSPDHWVSAVLLATVAGCGMRAIPQAENGVAAAWGEVENQYQRRADLVPNLVATVQGYAKHERSTLEAVINARARATQVTIPPDQLTGPALQRFEQAQGELSRSLGRLLVVAERYPELKASESFRDLQVQLEGTENRIAIARRRYIETVQHYNNLVTVPPTSWTNAVLFHKKAKPQFTAVTPGAERAPEVQF